MSLTPFPALNLPSSDLFHEADQFAQQPDGWETMDTRSLQALFLFSCLFHHTAHAAGADLYNVVNERLTSSEREEVLLSLIKLAHRDDLARRQAFSWFAHFIFRDAEPAIVSSATIAAAEIASPIEEPMAAVLFLIEHAADLEEDERIGALFGGLLTLGHRGIHDLIEPCVLELNDQAFTRAVSLGAGNPLAATVERLATWALWCVTNGRENMLVPLLGRLGYLSKVANGETGDPRRQPLGRGVVDIERTLPVWTVPEGQVVRVIRRYSVPEFGRQLEPILLQIAELEEPPSLALICLDAWRTPPPS